MTYHGITHGIPANAGGEFTQEWDMYKDLSEAKKTINKVKEIVEIMIEKFDMNITVEFSEKKEKMKSLILLLT